jgi:hypothetical protein
VKLDRPVPDDTPCDVGAHTAAQVGRWGWHRIEPLVEGGDVTMICRDCHDREAAYARGYVPPEV